MPTIHDAYINALLADATYALDRNVDNLSRPDLILALTTRMTLAQATYIADHFTMVTHTDANDIFGSGFDATVWQGKAGTPNASKTYVSMTGTQPGTDFLADIDLTVSGAARAQLIDMVNWWLKITTPSGSSAMQIKLEGSLSGQVSFINAPPVPGTGQLTGVNSVANLEVNGHSLGGFLASAFARLFGRGIGVVGKVGIDHVTTFNSAGFTGGSASVFNQIEQRGQAIALPTLHLVVLLKCPSGHSPKSLSSFIFPPPQSAGNSPLATYRWKLEYGQSLTCFVHPCFTGL